MEHYLLSDLPLLARPPEPDDFLLYAEKRSAGGRLIAATPKRKISEPATHRWWYRQLRAAGFVGHSVTRGMNMHLARQTFARDLRRIGGLGAASQALGHSDISTTASIYGHYDLSDLEQAMDALAWSRREDG